ncbi:MAG TPA: hypothetical protein VH475_22235 [Tepidisphaeraceae bacterium]
MAAKAKKDQQAKKSPSKPGAHKPAPSPAAPVAHSGASCGCGPAAVATAPPPKDKQACAPGLTGVEPLETRRHI